MIRVIDVNSGTDVREGDTVRYAGGDWWTLQRIEDRGRWRVRALVIRGKGADLSVESDWLPVKVRHLHPAFFLERVGFVDP